MRFTARVLFLLVLAGVATAPCAGEIIAQHISAPTNGAVVSTTWTHAQGFYVGGTPTVSEIQVNLQRWKGSTGSLYLELRGTTQDEPAAGYYRRLSKPVTDVPVDAPAWVSFALSPGTQIGPGTFWIVLSVSSVSDVEIDWQTTAGNLFGNGNDFMTSFDVGSTWPTLSSVDANFKVIGSRTSTNTNTTVTATPTSLCAGGDSYIEVTVRDTAANLVQGSDR